MKLQQAISDERHFYASSIAEWRVSEKLEDLIKDMKKSEVTFGVWMVPTHKSAPYEIRGYRPQVEGTTFLGTWEPK